MAYTGKQLDTKLYDVYTKADTDAKIVELAPEQIVKSATAPSNPASGDFWFDTDDFQFKFYDGTDWQLIKSAFAATGGAITEAGGYRYHAFTTSGTFEVTKGSTDAEVLVVAGGGGGGNQVGGGGGAGGYVHIPATSLSVGTYSIVVGAGGAGSTGWAVYATSGGNSSFPNQTTAIGGGRGGNHNNSAYVPEAGGSGGGGGANESNIIVGGASGTSGQGYAGGQGHNSPYWSGGGGGGAGAVGQNATDTAANRGGDGGVGIQFTAFQLYGTSNPNTYITGGVATNGGGWFCGGGGGCCNGGSTYNSIGGAGGGGRGFENNGQAINGTTHGDDGAANTGGGGGGTRDDYAGDGTGLRYTRTGSGGSGIVIIRYPI